MACATDAYASAHTKGVQAAAQQDELLGKRGSCSPPLWNLGCLTNELDVPVYCLLCLALLCLALPSHPMPAVLPHGGAA